MKILKALLTASLCMGVPLAAQNTFTITGTAIPAELLKLNYGNPPKGIQGYDLNICNMTNASHPITSSEIYQALVEAESDLRPIGRQIMLAAILRNQNHTLKTWLSLGLGSTTSVLSVLGTSKTGISSGALSGAALGALIGQQLLSSLNPVLTADQVEKFEAQVLENALVMDGGSCLERTVFMAVAATPKKSSAHARSIDLGSIQFHVR
jgi:hypothetical protein